MQTTSDIRQRELTPVSAVVVNYNAGALLIDCVRAALDQASQVIVVDNASSDSSLETLEACFAGEKRIKLVRNGVNKGFAVACNIGFDYCTEKHILFLNPDCILGSNALAHMVRTLEDNPKAGMIGGLLTDPNGVEQGGGRRAMPTPWRSFVRAFGLSRLADRWPRLFYDFHLHKQILPQIPLEVEAISGALMLVRREAIENVGLWDEKYFLHCEDLDWCMRFRKSGWSILFDAAAPAIHFHGVCSAPRPIFVEWHKHKGMVRFYLKFFRHQYPGVLMWLVILGVWMRFIWVAPLKALKRIFRLIITNPEEATSPPLVSQSASPAAQDQSNAIAVIGASSMVGSALLPLLVESGNHVICYSRKSKVSPAKYNTGVEWREMGTLSNGFDNSPIEKWIWLAPIKVLPQYLPLMQRAGAKHIVAVSTTSRFTKNSSSSEAERQFVGEVIAAEEELKVWASKNSGCWTILRPTLIYGLGMDKNVNTIARFIKKFHFFPTLGAASGLRQPVHARDVAYACEAALFKHQASSQAYNISGAEVISYREMVGRIFQALSIRPLLIPIPLWLFGLGVAVVRILPRYKTWSTAMAERMNQDMVFDHSEATNDLEYHPQRFILNADDLPSK